jgi:hypothetical protein
VSQVKLLLQHRQAGYVLESYVAAAAYNNDWYIGCIITHDDEECDILIKFMERKW